MLVRELKHLLPFLGPLIILLLVAIKLCDKSLIPLPSFGRLSLTASTDESKTTEKPLQQSGHPISGYTEGGYYWVFSASTADKKFFQINFDKQHAINPNVIPHPFREDTWIIVSQLHRSSVENTVFFAELVCNAVFKDGALSCMDPPMILPIAATPGGSKCQDSAAPFALSIGPHDARVFYGPSTPYVMYGSTSEYTCFGQWVLDFRLLVDWGFELFEKEQFRTPTELQRPPPYGVVEKNWFVFWDKDEQIYAHYDIAPKRVFAKLSYDGSVGPDLAPLAAASDAVCMAKYLPKIGPEDESLHQATNSLSITLCKRSDAACKPNDTNTFIINIFHYKKFHNFHSVYEPYVMLFQQAAPFAIYGISSKPLWISGRGKPGEWGDLDERTAHQTQMLYVTSLSWKKHGQKYHGYIDDVMFVLFGIEDTKTGGIDVVAADLLMGLGLCAS